MPEPETPVTTVSRPIGMSTEMFRRLWVRAPRMRMTGAEPGFVVRFKRTRLPSTVTACRVAKSPPPPCAGQYGVGAVPSMNTSVVARGQPGAASRPVSASISAVTMSDGTGNASAKYWAGMKREKSAKIGTAACVPERFRPRLSS